ncbi:uncharacterized protein N7459_009002 [Penicillium hispanicum]|uniref:uncharacterized protein n=1 Tax=Penicillium hispanicum TaxID=1080232 RepID=UPI00254031CA|nr:uncharacterized protein N7459_009002 [Penicillium hispanicum]KAJ5569572.1 hypothetical protein N7459_009002 [Penicillium hispanicum]
MPHLMTRVAAANPGGHRRAPEPRKNLGQEKPRRLTMRGREKGMGKCGDRKPPRQEIIQGPSTTKVATSTQADSARLGIATR